MKSDPETRVPSARAERQSRRALQVRCERLLVGHAALYWRGRSSRLRRLVRLFLRRHRGDASLLEWILGSVKHAVLAALVLLHLLAEPARAGNIGPFVEQTTGINPLNAVDVGDYSAPAFVDIDGDGDLDAFIG